MSNSKPKKAASKKTVKTTKTAPVESKARESVPEAKPEAVDGVEQSRLRRLKRRGIPFDRCALLGIKIDIGPRASLYQTPSNASLDGLSYLGDIIERSGVSPQALRLAADKLEERETWEDEK